MSGPYKPPTRSGMKKAPPPAAPVRGEIYWDALTEMADKYEKTTQPFSGEWEALRTSPRFPDWQELSIKGNLLTRPDGSTCSLAPRGADACCFEIGSEIQEGTLSPDGTMFTWDDGAIWVRKEGPSGRRSRAERDLKLKALEERYKAGHATENKQAEPDKREEANTAEQKQPELAKQEEVFSCHDGYLPSGGDVARFVCKSLDEAKSRCLAFPSSRGFTLQGDFSKGPVNVYFKDRWELQGAGSGWTSYRREGAASASPPGATASSGSQAPAPKESKAAPVKLTLKEALAMQKELFTEFAKDDFQNKLEEVEASHGKAYNNLTPQHAELFLSVQNEILPKYGFEAGKKGVNAMMLAVATYNSNSTFHKNRVRLNKLLGLTPLDDDEIVPPSRLGPKALADGAAGPSVPAGASSAPASASRSYPGAAAAAMGGGLGAGSGAGAPRASTAPKPQALLRPPQAFARPQAEDIEVAVVPLGETSEVKVVVSWDATFYDVKEALSKLARSTEVLRTGQFMRQEPAAPGKQPTYSPFQDGDLVGSVRQVFLSEKDSSTEESSRVKGPGFRQQLEERRQARALQRQSLDDQRQMQLQSEAQQRTGIDDEEGGSKEEEESARKERPKRERRTQEETAPRKPCFLVVGGDDGNNTFDTTEAFDPDAMSFSPGPKMGSQRSGAAVVDVGTGKLLVAGGSVGAKCLETSEVLNLRLMRFAPGPELGGRRAGCAAVGLGDGRALLIGGRDRSARLDTTEVVDLTTFTSEPGPKLAVKRTMCAAVLLEDAGGANKRVLVIGGHDGGKSLATTEVLDLDTMRFSSGPRLRNARFGCTAAVVGGSSGSAADTDGQEAGPRIVVVAGGVGEGSSRLDSTEFLEVEAFKAFSLGPRLAKAKSGCAALPLPGPARRILLVGGQDGSSRFGTTEVLDLDSKTSTPGPALSTVRSGCTAIAC